MCNCTCYLSMLRCVTVVFNIWWGWMESILLILLFIYYLYWFFLSLLITNVVNYTCIPIRVGVQHSNFRSRGGVWNIVYLIRISFQHWLRHMKVIDKTNCVILQLTFIWKIPKLATYCSYIEHRLLTHWWHVMWWHVSAWSAFI